MAVLSWLFNFLTGLWGCCRLAQVNFCHIALKTYIHIIRIIKFAMWKWFFLLGCNSTCIRDLFLLYYALPPHTLLVQIWQMYHILIIVTFLVINMMYRILLEMMKFAFKAKTFLLLFSNLSPRSSGLSPFLNGLIRHTCSMDRMQWYVICNMSMLCILNRAFCVCVLANVCFVSSARVSTCVYFW